MDSSTAPSRGRLILLALLVGLAPVLVYLPTLDYGFVNVDDAPFVEQNPFLRLGLTPRGVAWAFGADLLFLTDHADYWQPVTILSRILDVTLYGGWAGGHHLTNAIGHGVNAALLFLLVASAGGRPGAAAFTALAWALHPMLAGSVAWVADRKAILAMLFGLAALLAHARLHRRPLARWAAGVLPLFALALASKPAIAPLPVIWFAWTVGMPNRWFSGEGAGDGVSESAWNRIRRASAHLACGLPFAAASWYITQRAQPLAFAGAPLPARLVHALESVGTYVLRWLAPTPFACFYPFPAEIEQGLVPVRDLALAALAAIAVALLASWAIRAAWVRSDASAPQAGPNGWPLVGLAWFGAGLTPVLMLTHESWATRFMYFPSAGLAIAVVMGARNVIDARPRLFAVLAPAILLLLAALTGRELPAWRDSTTLFTKAVALTTDNHFAHRNLAIAAIDRGDMATALEHLQEALRIRPGYPSTHYNIGVWFERNGRDTDAMMAYGRALELNPAYADARYNRGSILLGWRRPAEAVQEFDALLATNPDNPEALNNLGAAWFALGHPDTAYLHFAAAYPLHPRPATVALNAGNMLLLANRRDQARSWFERVLEHDPGNRVARERLETLAANPGNRPG